MGNSQFIEPLVLIVVPEVGILARDAEAGAPFVDAASTTVESTINETNDKRIRLGTARLHVHCCNNIKGPNCEVN
jgi:hypothetical protein